MSDTPYEGVSKYMLLLCTTHEKNWCSHGEQYRAVGTKKENSQWHTYEYTDDIGKTCTLTVGDIHHSFKITARYDRNAPRWLSKQEVHDTLREDKPQPISPIMWYDPLIATLTSPPSPPSVNPINIQPGSISQSYRGV